MATSKTVNVTTGKFLNYQVTKTGYKPVTGTVYVDSNKTINVNMVSTESQEEVYKLGDRILDMASFVCYYKPGGIYDFKPISTTVISQTHGSGLANLGVKKGIFEVQVNPTYDKTAGIFNHEFIYNGSNWTYDENDVNLEDYGIFYNTASSTVSNNDKIEVVYTVYNKYACFVLDAKYRSNKVLYNQDWYFTPPNFPRYGSISSGNGTSSSVWYYDKELESATWCSQYLLDNCGYTWSILPAYKYCRELGKYIFANGIELYPIIPNITEMYNIWINRVFLDSIDPVIQSGITSYNLSNWNFSNSQAYTSQLRNSSGSQGYPWYCRSNGDYEGGNSQDNRGVIPIFEVPVF